MSFLARKGGNVLEFEEVEGIFELEEKKALKQMCSCL